MTEKNIKRLDSAIQTVAFCELPSSVAATSGIANFAPQVAVVKGKIVICMSYNQLGAAPTSGITLNVIGIRVSMMQGTYLLANALFSFAASQTPPDNNIMAECKLNKGTLENMSKQNCVNKCATIQQLAAANAANILPFGATATNISDTGDLVALYLTAIDDPRGAKMSRASANTQAVVVLNQIMDVELELKLDTMANTLRFTNNEWWLHYRAAREIVDPGTFSTVLKIQVLNEVSGFPLYGVKCYHGAASEFKKSSKKGFITFKDPAQGNHQFLLKHKLFEDKTLTDVMINYGEKKDIVVNLKPLSSTGGITIVREGDIPSPGQVPISLTGVNGTPASMVTIQITGPAGVRFGAVANELDPPGPTHYDKEPGTVTMPLDQFIALVGFGPGLNFLVAQNIGMALTHYKLTFTDLEP